MGKKGKTRNAKKNARKDETSEIKEMTELTKEVCMLTSRVSCRVVWRVAAISKRAISFCEPR
jgi:hypothetical protein